MTETNPYKVYADETILNASPVGLIVALYEGAIDASVNARRFLAEEDIPARTKAINKLMNIVNELVRSLNDEKGGEVSVNLRRLYTYIQRLAIEAHTKKRAAPLQEVERLMGIMLEGWKAVNQQFDPSATINAAFDGMACGRSGEAPGDYAYADAETAYGGYLPEASEFQASAAYSF